MDAQTRRERFEEIAPALIEPLRRFLARRTDPATADDVLADTLLVCWRRFDELPDEPLPWAYAVARNCLANAERGARRQLRVAAKISVIDPPRASAPGPGQAGPGTDDPAGGWAGGWTDERADERADDLAAALAALRPDDAELLRLWAWEQLTPGEIAGALDISTNAAGIRLHRAREKLRAELRKSGRASGHEGSREGRRP